MGMHHCSCYYPAKSPVARIIAEFDCCMYNCSHIAQKISPLDLDPSGSLFAIGSFCSGTLILGFCICLWLQIIRHSSTEHGKPVDMWSAGVILFMLLGGYPPFYDRNEQKMFLKIEECDYDFNDPVWEDVSEGWVCHKEQCALQDNCEWLLLHHIHNKKCCCGWNKSYVLFLIYLMILYLTRNCYVAIVQKI